MPERQKSTKRTRAKTKHLKQASTDGIKTCSQPSGFRVGGTELASLQEVLDPIVPTLSLGELTEQQRIKLVLARLEAKPHDYAVSMIGAGTINKARAIAEVQAHSRVGRTLVDIEQMILETLLENKSRER